ncbi:MAG: Rieske 2Fe-2S domain-containing protein [Euryarchaeota archaeon]|jgi:nitrite reductase/ring-hydroxylating ferredoxin subunit|nr:MAG: putative 2Fe-2S cluster binding domain protein [uncultured Candidatus Poseidoniales archaeon]MBT3452080.1 Rieske 2Fe-2S domain-containing protein [Euryarchaeota archaeon]MDA8550498.1 Rieske 2Fe-2S domain-containing protein [Candidatus Poseidoniales archaeon]MDB0004384.1 Rieske 2Fe-2S domain-containing protein [Candidatus Poseidoniaceae archaeon]MBT5121719.1 Rieske 2Fe-2S domain-containing protein [Euryarchaeota archaeon]
MVWKNAIKVKKLKPGKTKMVTIGAKVLMVGHIDGSFIATEGLCRHMRWPLAVGGKIKDGCIRCPLHQTTHDLSNGELVEWSPFPLLPAYGRLVGKMSKQKDLHIYNTRIEGDHLQVEM